MLLTNDFKRERDELRHQEKKKKDNLTLSKSMNMVSVCSEKP